MSLVSPGVDLREVGAVFKQRRTRLGLYKTDTARAAGMSVRQVGRIESGEGRVSDRAYYAVAVVLGMTDAEVDDLFRGAAA